MMKQPPKNCLPPCSAVTKQQGFTLLEIIIALALLALALTAAVDSVSSYSNHASHLRDKTFAHWVAVNRLTEMQVTREYPSLGKDDGKAEMGNVEWEWRSLVTETPNPAMRQIRIEVGLADTDGTAAVLHGYMADPNFGL